MTIRIVIADDHAIVREGLKRIVGGAQDLQVTGEAADGGEVMKAVRELEFDVLVLDLSMPGRSGMELIKLVKSEKPKLRILVLSMHQETQYAVRGRVLRTEVYRERALLFGSGFGEIISHSWSPQRLDFARRSSSPSPPTLRTRRKRRIR